MRQLIDPKPLLSPREVADRLCVSRATVYRLLDHDEADRLPAVRIGGQIRVASDELDAWVAHQRVGRTAAERG